MEPPAEQEIDFSEVYAMEPIGFNARILNFCRVFVAIISGCAAGIMGITGVPGFPTNMTATPTDAND